MAKTPRRYRGGGATWTVDCRWRVRLLDEDGEPLGTWRYCDTLRDCREHMVETEHAWGAEVKRDGVSYGRLTWGQYGPVLCRVT